MQLFKDSKKWSTTIKTTKLHQNLQRVFVMHALANKFFELNYPIIIDVVIITMLQMDIEQIGEVVWRNSEPSGQVSNPQVGIDI